MFGDLCACHTGQGCYWHGVGSDRDATWFLPLPCSGPPTTGMKPHPTLAQARSRDNAGLVAASDLPH